jgi:hypothetical protein
MFPSLPREDKPPHPAKPVPTDPKEPKEDKPPHP